jgi:hypothetical protein
VDERLPDSVLIDLSFKIRTHLTELFADTDRRPDGESLADEMVQGEIDCGDVPPVDAWIECDAVLPYDCLQCLALDKYQIASVTVSEGSVR